MRTAARSHVNHSVDMAVMAGEWSRAHTKVDCYIHHMTTPGPKRMPDNLKKIGMGLVFEGR
eukprot:356348-Chlamydomonas_euryale.AAC.18